MAEPRESYPETATNAARKAAGDVDGEAALREALAANGDELAAVVDSADELQDVLATAVLIVASADEAELDHVTESTANLVAAADGLSTEAAAALATDVGENADDLSAALDTVLELQREGHLDDLVDLAKTLSALDVEPETVAGLNDVLAAVGEARRDPEPVGLLGLLGGLRSRDARAGLGYLVALLKAQGRRVRER